jgi:hypothetical protein
VVAVRDRVQVVVTVVVTGIFIVRIAVVRASEVLLVARPVSRRVAVVRSFPGVVVVLVLVLARDQVRVLGMVAGAALFHLFHVSMLVVIVFRGSQVVQPDRCLCAAAVLLFCIGLV